MKPFYLILFVLPHLISSEIVNLTDETWKIMLNGQWMVEFYAPWCPSCQHFQSVWKEFSDSMQGKDLNVSAIDISKYPSLSGRFAISYLPTIYYVRNGFFRQFTGERSLTGLKNYIENELWKATDPVSTYIAPNSLSMAIVGSIFDVSLLVKNAYTYLQDQQGWPSWLIYVTLAVSVLLTGLFLGFGVLLFIDYCLCGYSEDETACAPDDDSQGESNDSSDDSKSTDDSEDEKDSKVTVAKKLNQRNGSKANYPTSSTPHRQSSRRDHRDRDSAKGKRTSTDNENIRSAARRGLEASNGNTSDDNDNENPTQSDDEIKVRRRK